MLARRLRTLTGAGDGEVLPVSYPLCWNVDSAVQRVVERVTDRLGGGAADVDVVAVSMGGLIARAAAAPATARRVGNRLHIARLFTLATPHRGARLSRWIAPDSSARAMRPGSDFLRWLDEAYGCAEYRLICYTRLGDTWVGATNTAPAGVTPIWFPRTIGSHIYISQDPRITLDIARRLRAEEPLFEPAAPPPHD
jgi:pimeloyl-ACP methyl ester carboxylesterase